MHRKKNCNIYWRTEIITYHSQCSIVDCMEWWSRRLNVEKVYDILVKMVFFNKIVRKGQLPTT